MKESAEPRRSRTDHSPPSAEAKGWDIIPDIHGQAAKLERLLAALGYEETEGAYRHPERRVLFLGDYIDRGPNIRRVLQIVRTMVEAGEAVALMGNHEINALHFHHNGPDGTPLRPHNTDKVKQHAATLEQLPPQNPEWREWLTWFKTLPLTFENEEFRAVHACWDDAALAALEGQSLHNSDFLRATADKKSDAYRSMETILKGPEVKLPAGVTFKDKEEIERDTIRVRWWGLDDADLTFDDLVMPPGRKSPHSPVPKGLLLQIPNYPAPAKPVFIGHYWLTWTGRAAALAENVVCLDFSAGLEGPLVGCRWNGSIANSEFVSTQPEGGVR